VDGDSLLVMDRLVRRHKKWQVVWFCDNVVWQRSYLF